MRDAEESIDDVIISTDGSWKAVSDSKDSGFQVQNGCQDDTRFSAAKKLVVPEVNERNQSAASALGSVPANSTSMNAQRNNVSVAPPVSSIQSHALPDAASLAPPLTSIQSPVLAMQNQHRSSTYLTSQLSSCGVSRNEFERFTAVNRQDGRNQSSICSCVASLFHKPANPIGAFAGRHDSFQEGLDRINHASRSNLNAPVLTATLSSSMQNRSVRQVFSISNTSPSS